MRPLLSGPLPSIFGLHAATYVLCELAGKPIWNPLPIKYRKKLYERLLRDLLTRESKLTGQVIKYVTHAYENLSIPLLTSWNSKLPIDEDDVALIFEDIHRGRSVIPPHNVPSRPVLLRWDLRQPVTLDNCVVMDHGEAEKHAKGYGEIGNFVDPNYIWGTEVQDVVNRRAEEIRKDRLWVM